MALGIYLHVPFCRTRCDFCAFYLRIHREDWVDAYLTALKREIDLHRRQDRLEGRPASTLYFGGGTPTTLRPGQLADVLDGLRTGFGLAPDAEVTLEAHPESVTAEGLARLREAGFNRISFGIQSMDEAELIEVGRPTARNSVERAVHDAGQAGFDNLNLDLIYGLPGQTMKSWLSTVEAALSLRPTHLACYALTVEDKTHLQISLRRGERGEPDQELQNAMEEEASACLARAGFLRYEISNYCRPGFACRHNLLYWQDGDYLGLGPSAQSYVGGCRFGNVPDLALYQEKLGLGEAPTDQVDQLSAEQRRRESVVFGLRLLEGVEVTGSAGKADPSMDPQWERRLQRLTEKGLLEKIASRIRLTSLGRRFADQVAVELL
jgi:oxygen-independent coproporphyrinogen-3 oxidase